MSGEMLGSLYNQNGYSTARMRNIWSDKNRIKVICQVEVAVAYAMAKNGKIPEKAYQEIQAKLVPENIDPTQLKIESARAGHFLAGFVTVAQPLFDDDSGQYVHYGAASEDVEDTAFVLQLKESDRVLKAYLNQLGKILYQLCEKYQRTPTAAIAHKTYAAPTTLGFKLGIILNELDYLMRRLDSLGSFTFAGSLAGADGTSSMLGADYQQVEADFCAHLGLSKPEMYWHTQRERFTEYCHVETMIAQALGRLGKNLLYMSQTIVGEFQEAYAPGRQGSTVVPTVCNPYMVEAIVNLATVIKNEMGLMYDTMTVDGEKDTTVWRDLYVALPEMTMYLSGQLNYAINILKFGQFNPQRMRQNLSADDGTIYSGSLMMALAKFMGRENAHGLLVKLRDKADHQQVTLRDLFYADATIAKYLSKAELDRVMTPNDHLDNAISKTEQILKLYKARHFNVNNGKED
ncbi:lyase family protein [Lentilactobacillus parakefiri]|uniref:Adenylosuccinate lyase n=1 Tax=Lentilactobacillus parakefiri TaxID=152332 RepID=A0A224VEC9_9LACO|nr:lyase family protein [Lentilactobacillus parakefiri]KRL72957.1 3-carboxy-cis,cis-muconate cycloisomerase [Lentilactobacillus parakefiri DSM 10551]TDG92295.1 hypothetical protein C5L28_002026 [Lentilactobacillus parakefiri]GAW71483.1 adenylosuccinate lyase [Lentilactobacillus parakefiri]